MQDQIDLTELREALLEAPQSGTTRLLAIALSTALLFAVLLLVRRRSLRAEYTPLWVVVALCVTVLSLRPDLLLALTRAIGAWAPSSTFFFLGEVVLVLLCLHYSVRLSQQALQIKDAGAGVRHPAPAPGDAPGRRVPLGAGAGARRRGARTRPDPSAEVRTAGRRGPVFSRSRAASRAAVC